METRREWNYFFQWLKNTASYNFIPSEISKKVIHFQTKNKTKQTKTEFTTENLTEENSKEKKIFKNKQVIQMEKSEITGGTQSTQSWKWHQTQRLTVTIFCHVDWRIENPVDNERKETDSKEVEEVKS